MSIGVPNPTSVACKLHLGLSQDESAELDLLQTICQLTLEEDLIDQPFLSYVADLKPGGIMFVPVLAPATTGLSLAQEYLL